MKKIVDKDKLLEEKKKRESLKIVRK